MRDSNELLLTPHINRRHLADCCLLPAEERESCSSVNTIKQAPQLSFPPDQLSEVSSIAPLRDGVCSRMGSAAAVKD